MYLKTQNSMLEDIGNILFKKQSNIIFIYLYNYIRLIYNKMYGTRTILPYYQTQMYLATIGNILFKKQRNIIFIYILI